MEFTLDAITQAEFVFKLYGAMPAGIIYAKNFLLQLESSIMFVAVATVTHHHCLFWIYKDEMKALLNEMNYLITKFEADFGSEVLVSWKNSCRYTMVLASSGEFVASLVPCIYSFLVYKWTGKVAPVFYAYIIFGNDDRLETIFLYHIILAVPTAVMIALCCAFSAAITGLAPGVIETIGKEYERVGPSTVHILPWVINWHSIIVQWFQRINSLFGPVFACNCLITIYVTSLTWFGVFKVGLESESLKYIFICIVAIIYPGFFCVPGHLISTQGDKLFEATYQNEWYLLSPNQRKDLILPAKIGHSGLTLKYKYWLNFNMATQLTILQQSYTLVMFLFTMGIAIR